MRFYGIHTSNFTVSLQATSLYEFEKYIFKLAATSPRGQLVKRLSVWQPSTDPENGLGSNTKKHNEVWIMCKILGLYHHWKLKIVKLPTFCHYWWCCKQQRTISDDKASCHKVSLQQLMVPSVTNHQCTQLYPWYFAQEIPGNKYGWQHVALLKASGLVTNCCPNDAAE